MKKLFFILLSAMTLGLITVSYAVDTNTIYNYYASGNTNLQNFGNLKNTLFTVFTWIGWAAAVCVTLITGIKFLTANSQQKAQLKEKLWLIVLGVFILACGTSILRLIANILMGFANTL